MLTATARSRGGIVAAGVLALALLAGPLAGGAGAQPTKGSAKAAPICPSSTANGRFVRFIYLNILGRCPEAAAATYWTAKLDAGGLRWGFAESIDMSNENVGVNNVDGLYQDILGRKPTAEERTAGFAEIRKNHQDAHIIAALFSSDEGYKKNLGAVSAAHDQAWLSEAFTNIVDRKPTAAEVTHYTPLLGSPSTESTRHKIALSLELSDENMQGWTGAVIGAGLQRAPKPSDFATWVPWLLTHDRQTFRMWTHVLSSNEGFALAQTQPNPPPDEH